MLKGLPDGLLVKLESIVNPSAEAFQAAPWLESPFPANTWKLRFGEHERSIDWAVRFGKGRLTDTPHAKMLNTFKTFLICQGNSLAMRGRTYDGPRTRVLVYRGARLVDYLLLQQDRLKLARYGFALVTENDFDQLLFRCAAGPNDDEVIYRWTERLAEWLDDRVRESYDDVMALVDRHKVFSDISLPVDEWTLTKDAERLASWRAVMWRNGIYNRGKRNAYLYSPSTTKLAQAVYANTIFGKDGKSIHEELCLYPAEKYWREYPRVDVRASERGKPSKFYVQSWRSTILSMAFLESVGSEVPVGALAALRKSEKRYEHSTPGRFRNPPFWQVLDGIKNGVDFVLDHGEALLDSYANLLEAARGMQSSPIGLALKTDIREFLTKGALDLGVNQFCLRCTATNWPRPWETSNGWSRRRFFNDLRSGRGFMQNIQVLYGAMIHVIGPITARRQSELVGLPVIGCLDVSRTYLVFRNAKSGAAGVRQEELRPIPPIVEQIVSLVESFQRQLIEMGALTDFGALLSIPGNFGMRAASPGSFNDSLDVFCDYFDTPLDANGHRYYLREHQFRRFLIIAFFFGARRGNLHTLRWFVGHTDAAHLWHYLTNTTSGDMRREAAAYFLMDELRLPEEQRVIEIHERVHRELADLAEAQFGMRQFSLIDADVLEDYLNLQMKKGLVVEPEFLPGTGGHQYKIVARIQRAQ